jgi:uncharacterized membrane protein
VVRSPWFSRICLVAIAVIAAALRLRSYANSGLPNADEYDWAWSGLTLIQNHVPTGWTDLVSAYPVQTDMWWQGNDYNLVTPYLDHPPVFSLLVGGVSWLAGARVLTDVSLTVIRLIPITLSLVALILIFRLVRDLLGQGVALLTILMIAISPTAISLARTTESEALVVIWLLGALLALEGLAAGPSRRTTWLLLACCGLAPLTKVPGVFVGLAAGGVLLYRRDLELAILVGLATLAGIAGYILYGGLFDANLSIQVWAAYGERHTSWLGGYELIRGGWGDWLWLLGFVGLVALVVRNRRGALALASPVVAYLIIISATARPSNAFEFDWYRIPIEVLVYAGSAFLLVEVAGSLLRLAAKKEDLNKRDLYQAALPGITSNL